jgi:mannose-6-phosphate isomerase-like protein (cupin superfamily)
MMPTNRRTPRISLALSMVAAGVLGLFLLPTTRPEPVARQGSNFMGGTPSQLDIGTVRTLRLRFPAGSRSNWHSHTEGQLLMVEEGRGRTQDRGGPIREALPGQPWWTPAGVEHWHGAAPDEAVVQLTIYGGDVTWLQPVPDAEYRAAIGTGGSR